MIDPKPKIDDDLNFNQFQFENFNNDDGNLFEQLRAILQNNPPAPANNNNNHILFNDEDKPQATKATAAIKNLVTPKPSAYLLRVANQGGDGGGPDGSGPNGGGEGPSSGRKPGRGSSGGRGKGGSGRDFSDMTYSDEQDTVTLKEMSLVVRNNHEAFFATQNPVEGPKKQNLYFWQQDSFTVQELKDIQIYKLKNNIDTQYPYTNDIFKSHKSKGKRFISKLAINCYVTFIGFYPQRILNLRQKVEVINESDPGQICSSTSTSSEKEIGQIL